LLLFVLGADKVLCYSYKVHMLELLIVMHILEYWNSMDSNPSVFESKNKSFFFFLNVFI